MSTSERDVLDCVVESIFRYNMFPQDARVGVAVSGGADSVCLLHVLRELRARWDLRLSVIHIDHGLRGNESDEDAEWVRALAANLDLPFHLDRAKLAAGNLEQEGRRARLAFYQTLIGGGLVDRVATGHTRSDQAETVLYRLLRGASLAGMRGILPVTREGLVRPLLGVSRGEVESYLLTSQLSWREDSSNRDVHFARNRLRHELLPWLRETFNPQLDEVLSRTAALALDEEEYWTTQLPRMNLVRGAVILPVETLRTAPALARRTVRAACELVKSDLRNLDFIHIERIMKLAQSSDGSGRLQVPGLDVFRSFDWLRFAPFGIDHGIERDFNLALGVPGRSSVPGSDSAIETEVVENAASTACCDRVEEDLDWQRIPGGLELRNWRPGDKYQPAGRTTLHSLKALFQDARIPLWERRSWPVITCNNEVIWAKRFGPGKPWAAQASTRWLLRVRETGRC